MSFINSVQVYKQTCPIKTLMKFLDKVYGAVGDYVKDDKGFAKCLYFQDSSMKDMFNFYPDRICIDSTYKRFEIDIYMYMFLCEDSNGRNYIIAVGFLQNNDIESLLWLFDTFKQHNPNWRKIKSMAVDPNIKPRELVRDSFPLPLIITCFYHAFASFQNYISCLNEFKTVSDEQKTCAIDLFKNLFYASSQSEFELHYQQYLALPEPLVSYLLEFWMPKQHEWRIPLDYTHEDVFQNLNLYLEELNNAVQSLFVIEKNYIEFIKKIFLMILLKKREKPSMFLQPVSFLYSRFSPEYQISKALTPYAAKFVIEQLDLSSEVSTDFGSASETYIFNYLGMSVSASATSCSCHFFLFTMLPCRHIFAVRKINYFCMFDESLIDYTWNMKYYQHTLACVQDYLTRSTDSRIPQDSASRATLSSHLFEISIPSLLELPKDIYESRLQLLKKLVQAWKMDDDVSLQFMGIEKSFEKKNDNSRTPVASSTCNKDGILSCYEEINSSAEIHSSQKTNNSNEIHSSSEQKNNSNEIPSYSQDAGCSNEIPGLEPSRSCQESQRISRQGLCNFNTNMLNGMHINLAYIFCVICLTKESCVEWLKSRGFLPSSMKCICKGEMISKNLLRLNDGVAWSCLKRGEKKCVGKRFSVRSGTWFEESNLTLEQILTFTYMWINKYSKSQIMSEIAISSAKYVKWDKFHRRICEASMIDDIHMEDQMDTSSYTDPLDRWLQKHAGEDTFLEFLKDAASVYKKDKVKNFPDSETE